VGSLPTWETAFTSMFMHGGLLHIGFNMLFLFVFGPQVEGLCGHLRLLAYYLLCGIAGGIAMLAVGPDSHVPTIGASGAIAGVLGGYLVNFPLARIRTIVPIGCFPLFLRLPALLVIGVWALAQFVTGFDALSARAAESQGGTAYFAHIGGFCAGVLLIGLMKKRTRRYA
jgi:membrane associated rhomboid family serine protease